MIPNIDNLDDYNVTYTWKQGAAVLTNPLEGLRPGSDTDYTLTVDVEAEDFRPVLPPTGTVIDPPSGLSGVGIEAVDISPSNDYTVNVVTPGFDSVSYDLFLGEKVSDDQSPQQDYADALVTNLPAPICRAYDHLRSLETGLPLFDI
jgi:hypothetical protein